MTWTNKVSERDYLPIVARLICCEDQEWLDAVNAERKKEQLNKVSYETFEIIMDRLEKEWFDLARSSFWNIPFQLISRLVADEEHPQT